MWVLVFYSLKKDKNWFKKKERKKDKRQNKRRQLNKVEHKVVLFTNLFLINDLLKKYLYTE